MLSWQPSAWSSQADSTPGSLGIHVSNRHQQKAQGWDRANVAHRDPASTLPKQHRTVAEGMGYRLATSPGSAIYSVVCAKSSIMSNSLIPYGLQPARPLCPWDSPGKNTGVGAVPSSRGSSRPRDGTYVSCTGRWALHHQHHPGSPTWPRG